MRALLVAGFFGLASSAASANTDAVKCVQGQLTELGFYTGEIDGKIGKGTRAASEQYKDWMKQNNPGWDQPSLNKSQSEFWCKQLASSNPPKLAHYLASYYGTDVSIAHVSGLSVAGPVSTTKPYATSVQFEVYGQSGLSVTDLCFQWNGRDELCVPMPPGVSNGPISLELTTGRAGDYVLLTYLKYVSGGKKLTSNQNTVSMIVAE
jgi:hypothetical protein